MGSDNIRMRPGDKAIDREAVREKLGGVAVSTVYGDTELMNLRVFLTAAGAASSRANVRWIAREVDELINRRIEASAKRLQERAGRKGTPTTAA
jgi:hypothetical protein